MSKYLDQLGGLPIFEPPSPPPTGPEADEYTEEDGRPPAFERFLASEEGQEFWGEIQRSALDASGRGESRFSCLGFIHSYRDSHKARVNNSYAPWFADILVMAHPELVDIIERRVRKKPGPFDGKAAP